MHELRIDSFQLVGGGRTIHFNPDFSVVRGTITSGKTTLVRLIRAMLGRVPDHLPPETDAVASVRARVRFGSEVWVVERPLVTTRTVFVNMSRRSSLDARADLDLESGDQILDAVRLPAVSPVPSESLTYQHWMLSKLNLPNVAVPSARRDPASRPIEVTINDWLRYCIIRDEELDTAVFGHRDAFVNRKRQAVFELVYGIYSDAIAKLEANLRSLELRLEDIDRTTEAVRGFLKESPLQSLVEIDQQLDQARDSLRNVERKSAEMAIQIHTESDSVFLRERIRKSEVLLSDRGKELGDARNNVEELHNLRRFLESQIKNLTKAIVAGDWLVDFEFVVCPRCGSGVEQELSTPSRCYLCHQEPHRVDSRESLIKEEARVKEQLTETIDLIDNRESEINDLERLRDELQNELDRLNGELEERTAAFVSLRSEALGSYASERASLRSNIIRLEEYHDLLARFSDHERLRRDLEDERVDVSDALIRGKAISARSDGLMKDLEVRFLDYLSRLNISLSDFPLTAGINRKTYLPEVDNRPFDELSSQGLTVLVNVAHALAHHTVAIDYELPLPGLLILDGLSSNVGHEGFDLERRDDTYRLLMEEAERYQDSLQIIALDNDVPSFGLDSVVATLTVEDRLVRPGQKES